MSIKIKRLLTVTSLSFLLASACAQNGFAASAASPLAIDWVDNAFGPSTPKPHFGGQITTADLLALRNIDSLSVSPDGRWVAFSIRQTALAINDYVVKWFVVSTGGASPPVALNFDGGQPIPFLGSGWIPSDPAKWSPDGSRLALRRRHGDNIALLIVDPSTNVATEVVDGASQVTQFAWSEQGALIFRTGFNAQVFKHAVQREARHGWLLDQRMPLTAARTPSPQVPDCASVLLFASSTISEPGCDRRTLTFESGGIVRAASASEAEDLNKALNPAARAGGLAHGSVGKTSSVLDDGRVAWTETFDHWETASGYPMRRIATNVPDAAVCANAACMSSIFGSVDWARNGKSIWFVKLMSSQSEELGPFDQYALYEWKLGSNEVRLIRREDDILKNCQAQGKTVFCARETSTRPTHIVAIDLDDGAMKVLADANLEFETKAFPKIEKITLRDKEGNPGYAHLVYPNNFQSGQTYPLVAVQYRSRGFLRGGIGDEYPIFPMAAEGFFVMSIEYPEDHRAARDVPSLEYQAANRRNKRQTRNVAYAIEEAVRLLVASGKVDPKRVAITGLSFGADVVHTALQNSEVFSVAIASSMQGDITTNALIPEGFPGKEQMLFLEGERSPLAGEGGEILAGAWSQRPERLRAPLLLNVAQGEAMVGFEGIAILKAAKRPIEVRVFPDEGHVKYYPQSYAGVYDNNMMWLKFWFKGEEDTRPEFRDQYVRWRSMRDRLESERKTAHK